MLSETCGASARPAAVSVHCSASFRQEVPGVTVETSKPSPTRTGLKCRYVSWWKSHETLLYIHNGNFYLKWSPTNISDGFNQDLCVLLNCIYCVFFLFIVIYDKVHGQTQPEPLRNFKLEKTKTRPASDQLIKRRVEILKSVQEEKRYKRCIRIFARLFVSTLASPLLRFHVLCVHRNSITRAWPLNKRVRTDAFICLQELVQHTLRPPTNRAPSHLCPAWFDFCPGRSLIHKDGTNKGTSRFEAIWESLSILIQVHVAGNQLHTRKDFSNLPTLFILWKTQICLLRDKIQLNIFKYSRWNTEFSKASQSKPPSAELAKLKQAITRKRCGWIRKKMSMRAGITRTSGADGRKTKSPEIREGENTRERLLHLPPS